MRKSILHQDMWASAPAIIDRLNLSFVITDGCDCGTWGDVNGDGAINPVDVVFMVNSVYLGNNMFCADPCN